MNKVYVFGHKNPDTDTVAAAISLSYLKNKLGLKTEPRVLGSLNNESLYAINTFGLEIPLYLNDVKVQIKDINYKKNYMINENNTILDAFKIMDKDSITGIPLVDSKKKFVGYLSLKEIARDMILNENIFVDTSFENLIYTLGVESYYKFDDNITGYAHAATFSDDTFLKDVMMDEQTILIVGDRYSIIKEAIEKKVKLIIVVKNKKIPSDLVKLIKQNRINVIYTDKSSFKVARLLCLANPIKSIKRNTETIVFNENDYLSEFIEETNNLKHTNYPIVDNKNNCLGMLRTIDAHEIKRKQVILVDHNTVGQSVDGLYESEILEIIDHHNIGDINTSSPINFRNMSVGSSNTIIYYLFQENKIKIPKEIAGIMLSGILSDTLMLKSPTTTQRDILVAEALSKIAKVSIKKYGLDLLTSGVSIEGMSEEEIINKDFKTYKVGDFSFGIGQVFTTDFKSYKDIMNNIVKKLNEKSEFYDFKVCALFVTNFLTNDSYIIYSDSSKRLLEHAYGITNLTQGKMLKGVVSRKKQIIPAIMDIIEHI